MGVSPETWERLRPLHEHLFDHLTDGLWHDNCRWCRVRRIRGGSGVSADERAEYERAFRG